MRKIGIRVHSGAVIAWLTFSTFFYGGLVILFSFFKTRGSYFFVKLWASQLLGAARIKVVVKGLEKLNRTANYVFVANHCSVFDIPALFVALPFQIGFLAKKELYNIIFFGKVLRTIGCVMIDRSNARKARLSITRAVEQLKTGKISLALFPEGTRSEDGNIAPFKSASFALVNEAKITMVPVYIAGSFHILKKNSLMIRPGTIRCEIADPIEIETVEDCTKNRLSEIARGVLVEMQERYTVRG